MTTSASATLRSCRGVLAGIGAFSFFVNLLQLSVPLYTWQLFDRVLASGSHETLQVLTVIAVGALVVAGMLEAIRARVLLHVGTWVDRRLGPALLASEVETSMGRPGGASARGLRDLGTLRGFLTGAAVFHLFDAPWVPIFLLVIWLLHPLLGAIAVAGALLLVLFVVAGELATRRPLGEANARRTETMEHTESNLRNAEVVQAMGMLPALLRRWRASNELVLAAQTRASNRGAALHAASRTLRLVLQVAILGAAAFLATGHAITAGGMIAASIILGRALSPIEQLTTTWRSVINARFAWRRMSARLGDRDAEAPPRTTLPPPVGRLDVENVTFSVPDRTRPVLDGVRFALEPGERLGVIGASGSGKSSLARLCIGLQAPTAGTIRLDGADVAQWPREQLGVHVGYLPQDVALFAGTVKENIARMATDADDAAVVEAARLAGIHEVVLRLPQGYDTEIGNRTPVLSGGQRQLVGFARALYGGPRLLVLDEPNANLDRDGEAILFDALDRLKGQGVTIIVITHRILVLQHVDRVLRLRSGKVDLLGARDEVLRPRRESGDPTTPAVAAGKMPADPPVRPVEPLRGGVS